MDTVTVAQMNLVDAAREAHMDVERAFGSYVIRPLVGETIYVVEETVGYSLTSEGEFKRLSLDDIAIALEVLGHDISEDSSDDRGTYLVCDNCSQQMSRDGEYAFEICPAIA